MKLSNNDDTDGADDSSDTDDDIGKNVNDGGEDKINIYDDNNNDKINLYGNSNDDALYDDYVTYSADNDEATALWDSMSGNTILI